MDGAWPDPAPLSSGEHAAAHEEWRQDRRDRLVTPPSGAVLWVGLWEIPEGATLLGSDPALRIVLRGARVPAVAGTLSRSGAQIRFEPTTEAITVADGTPVTEPLTLANDREDEPTGLRLGTLGMRVHAEPGTDRLWLRAWDEDHPRRDSFMLPESYPLDPAWRVAARFDPFAEPRALPVPDVTGGTVVRQAPGELVFRLGGREHRLLAIAGPTSTTYFVMMWDSTALSTTYEAGRYLRVPLADSTGWTTLDFNRAYNPPCVFTEYSVCGLPPPENRLDLAVTAGEKRVAGDQGGPP
jgi:uncharacterized protein (DUF1684 family)